MYKLGWSGINIDLNPLSIKLFNVARPRDINICAAVSDKKKDKKLYFHNELSPLNTITKEHTLLYRELFGIKNLKIKKIKTKTLKELLRKYNIKKIDFLNIDVEGHELEVLKTLNFNHFNIKVICIEIITITKKIKKRRNEIVKFLKKKKLCT